MNNINKKYASIVLIIALAVGSFFLLREFRGFGDSNGAVRDYKDGTYLIDKKPVQLKNGVSEAEAAPGSATRIVTRYFGNEVKQDLDGDGREDVAFLLTREMGGSGTFYYLAAAINTEDGYVGSHALYIGDRIAPQTTEVGKGGVIIVNYADRAPGESFAVSPSVGRSIWALFDGEKLQFSEVVQDLVGKVDTSKLSLTMKVWQWSSAITVDGKEVKPRQADAFSLTLSSGGTFSATTDCNSVSGKYTVKGKSLSFGQMASTKKFCEGSEEDVFTGFLSATESYHFTLKGEFILDLKGGGFVVFK